MGSEDSLLRHMERGGKRRISFSSIIDRIMSSIETVGVTSLEQMQALSSKKMPILIEFYAEWCRPCIPVRTLIQKALSESGYRLILARVDSEQSKQLLEHYNISELPTLILLDCGLNKRQTVIGGRKESILNILMQSKKV